MRIPKRFLAILMCLSLCLPSVMAQSPQSGTTISKEVAIMIEPQQVRFTTQKAIEEMRLQVFDPSGELIFDSGVVNQAEIDWPFQNGNGEAVKSGLYAYTLSTKESGQEAAQVRRGHFIVDRAKEQDGKTDHIWVTSKSDISIGTELKVAGNEEVTVAGVSAPATGGTSKILEGAAEQKQEEIGKKSDLKGAMDSALGVAGTGAVGQLAKFTSADGIGNSIISEVNGNVGIGTTTPSAKLDIRGFMTLEAGTSPTLFTAASGGEQNRYLHLINSPTYASASGLKAGGILVSDSYSFADPGKNDLVVKGNVGLGAPASLYTRLKVEGQDAITVHGYEPFITLDDGNSASVDSHRIQSAHGDLNFFHGYMPRFTNANAPIYKWVHRMIIKNNGNVGIGTADPGTKLHVDSEEARLRLQSSRSDLWTVTEYVTDARQWHTGVGGSAVFNGLNNKYYIYDASAGRVRFTIDTNGLVAMDSLQINGGSDFSENFDINPGTAGGEEISEKIEAGMVVSIDPTSPSKLVLSSQAYDRRVAGIISGAGGVKPGMVMSQEGTLANGKHPVALSGRVYCWVDASQGAIEPGDLLTTSNMPGYAIKASDPVRAQGAILGKAMTSLKSGKGLVLVLVTLQ